MKLRVSPGEKLSGICTMPGDKSVSHRAALIASIAEGVTEINNYSTGSDCRQTLQCPEKAWGCDRKRRRFYPYHR